MLRILRTHNPFSVIILLIFSVVIKLKVLIHPVAPVAVDQHFLFNYVLRLLHYGMFRSPFAFTLLAVTVVFIQALYLNSIAIRHKLFPRNTYIPAFVFLLLTSIYPEFSQFNETLLLNWLLLAAMDIMFGFQQTSNPRKLVYNAALLLSTAALFQSTFLLFFVLLLVCLILFRPNNTGEWIVALMGYLTPFYFLCALLYLFDRMHLLKTLAHIGFSISPLKTSPLFFIITMAFLILFVIGGFVAMARNVALSNIYVRRNWIAVSFYLIIAIIVAFVTDSQVNSAWLITIPPLSILCAHSLAFEKNKRFSNFMFYYSLVFLAFCLWANK